MKVLLFDIDLTLLRSGLAGRRAVNLAFSDLYGVEDAFRDVTPDGKTDPLIFREIFTGRLPGLSADAEMERVTSHYLAHLEVELQKATAFRLMPGVRELLEALWGRPGLALGLATGNVERGARLKVKRGGIDTFFRFGGFGSDSENRTELVRVAVTRAEALLGRRLSGDQVVVIGDTALDIRHAKEAGVRVAAVATGRTPAEELARHRPDLVFEDLSATGEVVARLLGGPAGGGGAAG